MANTGHYCWESANPCSAGVHGHIPTPCCTGAESALAALHATDGFMHGDIHRDNLLLAEGGSDTAPSVLVLDFGRSRFGATAQDQAQELKALQQLLRS